MDGGCYGVLGYEAMGLSPFFFNFRFGVFNYEATRYPAGWLVNGGFSCACIRFLLEWAAWPNCWFMNALRRLAALLVCLPAAGYAAFPTLYLKPVALEQIHSPTDITSAHDGSGRLFVCDQTGKIHILRGGMLLPVPFLDLSDEGLDRVFVHSNLEGYSERGLLGLCFHPDYEDAESPGFGRFYLNYTALGTEPTENPSTPQDCVTVIAEFRVSADNPDVADPASERILLTYGQPQSNHNGGQIGFGPDDFLYIASGDGGSANDNNAGHTGGSGSNPRPNGILGNGQDRRTLLGKILRIDPLGTNGPGGKYGIPVDNPFVGQQQDFTDNALDGPMRGEIYAYGLRNPWRFSFDQRPGGTNRMFCGDVGQGKVEEVNLITAGGNYGWRYREGSFVFDAQMATNNIAPADPIDPIAQYKHPGADEGINLPALGLSITGGYVYRGSAIPGMVGKYVFGDYSASSSEDPNEGNHGRLMGLEETSPGSGSFTLVETLPLAGGNPFSLRVLCLGEDESGELYVGTKSNGGVKQLDGGKPAGGIFKIVPLPQAGSVTLNTAADIKDTSLFSESDFSNGSGSHLFAGSAGGTGIRRAFIRFPVSENTLPVGSSVTSTSLILHVNQQAQTAVTGNFTVHKTTAAWGEGASNSNSQSPGPGFGIQAEIGDATWHLRMVETKAEYDSGEDIYTPPTGVSWSSPGGDFIQNASATVTIAATGQVTFTSQQLAQDVQSWADAPASNFGWCLRGPENDLLVARRFTSRNSSTTSQRPRLVIQYAFEASPPTHFEQWLATHFPEEPVGFYLDEAGDEDGDGITNLHEYAFGLSPVARDEEGDVTVTTEPGTGGQLQNLVTFRRDSAATDLTYEVQTSPDLVTWTTLATSLAGEAAQASNGGLIVSDAVLAGTVRLVTVRETLGPEAKVRRFVRVRVVRSF